MDANIAGGVPWVGFNVPATDSIIMAHNLPGNCPPNVLL